MALYDEPLDVDSYEIRILTIHPGPPASAVRCTLGKTTLINPINYAAISYCWGDPTITKDIFVNDIQTPITTNLADALQYLRKLGVYTLWADALCINQADKQEKGLQIRYMKHVYSKAGIAYTWLGREDNDTTAVIAFFMSLLDSHDNTALAQRPHTCRDQQDACQFSTQNEDCRCCTIQSYFQALKRILQHQYWKRRWIIQETSVSHRPILLYNDTAISLDEMEQVVIRCRNSCYWSSCIETADWWFMVVTEFRRSYQNGDKLSLCQAIKLSRNFESTDPRDVIFSLLALCYDGSELIPTPSYIEPVEAIMTNLTRALISKHKNLDFIWTNGTNRTRSEMLPSWAPDWLSGHTPSPFYGPAAWHPKGFIVQSTLGRSISRNVSLGDGEVLRVRGMAVCRIVSMTSITCATELSSPDRLSAQFSQSSPQRYYSDSEIRTALLFCLNTNPHTQNCLEETCFFPGISASWLQWQAFRLRCVPFLAEPSQLDPEASDVEESRLQSRRIIFQWLKINAKFPILGRLLEESIKKPNSWPTSLMRALDTPLYIPVMIGVLLVIETPIIVLTFALFFAFLSSPFWVKFVFVAFGSVLGFWVMLWGVKFIRYCFQYIRESKLLWDDWTHLVRSGKRLFMSDKGHLGMVDEHVEKGDLIFYLEGCLKALVLREVRKEDDAARNRAKYTIVGACYVRLNRADRKVYMRLRRYGMPTEPIEEWLKGLEKKGIIEELDLI